jgi:NCAIR mutase (PurE)-related protein
MNKQESIDILNKVKEGTITTEEASLKLRIQPFEDLGYAKPDHHRGLRQGIPEVIYGAGKTAEQIAGISTSMLNKEQKLILITRLTSEIAETVKKSIPLHYHEMARIGIIGDMPKPDGFGKVVVATGGTSDMPVAEEAALTAEALGNEVVRLYDVGVAGLHRLLSRLDDIMDAQVIIAISGMEGELASVIGGLADCPVIGVPTSIGYGASFNGLSALLTMLNSCASGVSVVNIDNGFGAGYLASIINHQGGKK